MADAIFLSAGVPDPLRGAQYAATTNVVAITSAVAALVHVTLGRRPLVWGGHPAITPMIWFIAQEIDVDYGKWVTLYQSNFFEDEFPEDNERFKNVRFTEKINDNREASLLEMRERMFSETQFAAAVFIGGMAGILAEFEMFRHFQPDAKILPVMSTGGATLEVGGKVSSLASDMSDDRDYVALFHRHLGISTREERYRSPEDQPKKISDRYWRQNKEHPSE
ncbi:hypothetical protein [Hoeflea alexandrii]|uniref:SLOG domain-containing protein n=1 Tax=Hoeflea alexandrii TaxID=288436 RepID=UPI0022AFDBAA|nr:hypothetical protein [Hoeflea alexandrii]MCZ4290364.1 hypothetical protein [Hoeflea alexandrii]